METNSVTPAVVNAYLEFHNESIGVTGSNNYNFKGELKNPEIFINIYVNGNLKRLIIPKLETELYDIDN